MRKKIGVIVRFSGPFPQGPYFGSGKSFLKKGLFVVSFFYWFLSASALKAQTVPALFIHQEGSRVDTLLLSNIDSLTYGEVPEPPPGGCQGVTSVAFNGFLYSTVEVGRQCWLGENLRSALYRNGDSIPLVSDNSQWQNLETGARALLNNNAANEAQYGFFYNWYAVADVRGLCPVGWHVPSDEEWTELSNFLGGEAIAGGKLKSVASPPWQSPNTGATNEVGFSALPGGSRAVNGAFSGGGFLAYWWSTTEFGGNNAWRKTVYNNTTYTSRYYFNKKGGFSVRCIKD